MSEQYIAAVASCTCALRAHAQGMQASMFSIMFNGPGGGGKGRGERRSMTVAEARPYLEEAEAERQFPAELLSKEAVSALCWARMGSCLVHWWWTAERAGLLGGLVAGDSLIHLCSSVRPQQLPVLLLLRMFPCAQPMCCLLHGGSLRLPVMLL